MGNGHSLSLTYLLLALGASCTYEHLNNALQGMELVLDAVPLGQVCFTILLLLHGYPGQQTANTCHEVGREVVECKLGLCLGIGDDTTGSCGK